MSITDFITPIPICTSSNFIRLRNRIGYINQKCFYYLIGTDPNDSANLLSSRVARVTDQFVVLDNGLRFNKITRRSTNGQYEIYSIVRKIVNEKF